MLLDMVDTSDRCLEKQLATGFYESWQRIGGSKHLGYLALVMLLTWRFERIELPVDAFDH